jgi:WhiB family transcriptional regulator, redox-sensing transcriptional regulator
VTATKYAGEWQAAGACLSADPEIFFPVSGMGASTAQIEQARRICAGCQVRRECLEYAMSTGESHGIWGGTTPEDRTRVRRQEAARRRHAARRSWNTVPGTRAS